MFGNMINNNQLKHLIEIEKLIDITPFAPELLKTAHYPLKPKSILKRKNGAYRAVHNYDTDEETYSLDENEYVLVEVRESIKLPEGIIGQFVPSSNLIEQGFGITAGRLEYPYGQKGEPIRFGLKNLLNESNELRMDDQLVYVQLFDLRGLDNNNVQLTNRDIELFSKRLRRAKGDGVDYGDGRNLYDEN